MTVTVAHVIDNLTQGGAQTLLRNIITHSPVDTEHRVVALGADETLRSSFEAAGIPVTVCDGQFRFDPRALYRLSGAVGSQPTDVVHTHLPYAQAFGRLAATINRIPIVSTYHDVPQSFCPDSHMRAFELSTRPLDNVAVGVSQGVVDEFKRGWYFGRFGSMQAIPNGVDIDALRTGVDTASGEEIRGQHGVGKELVFLTIGRLAEKKRQCDIIEAMATVLATEDDVHLFVVGGGGREQTVRDRVSALGSEDEITVTGRVPSIEPYYAAADVYVHAALYEGFGLTITEAMAVGLPVIATDVPGARDVVGDAGILVQPRTPSAIAEAMRSTLDADLRAELEQRATRHVEQFHIDTTAEAYASVYRSLVS